MERRDMLKSLGMLGALSLVPLSYPQKGFDTSAELMAKRKAFQDSQGFGDVEYVTLEEVKGALEEAFEQALSESHLKEPKEFYPSVDDKGNRIQVSREEALKKFHEHYWMLDYRNSGIKNEVDIHIAKIPRNDERIREFMKGYRFFGRDSKSYLSRVIMLKKGIA